MWKYGDIVSWRGIFNNCVWHVQPTIVVKDNPDELVLTLLRERNVLQKKPIPRKKHAKRWWDFKNNDWTLKPYRWHTNRLLLILEPEMLVIRRCLFWDDASDKFLCYYINFQVPFKRNHACMDTLDLELDIIINPDFAYEWKDLDDYQIAIEQGFVSSEHKQQN